MTKMQPNQIEDDRQVVRFRLEVMAIWEVEAEGGIGQGLKGAVSRQPSAVSLCRKINRLQV